MDRNVIALIGSCDQIRSLVDDQVDVLNSMVDRDGMSELQRLITTLTSNDNVELLPDRIRALRDHECYLVSLCALLAINESIVRKTQAMEM